MGEGPFQVAGPVFREAGVDVGQAVQAVRGPRAAVANHGEEVAVRRGKAATVADLEGLDVGFGDPGVGTIAVEYATR